LSKALLAEHLPHFPWLTRNMLDHYILTYSTDGVRVPKMIIAQEQTIVSGLTNAASPVRAATPSAIAMSTATSANIPGSTTTSTNEMVVTTTSSNKGGQRKYELGRKGTP
jgi:hypothetical protein